MDSESITAADVQASDEGVSSDPKIEFMGEVFELPDRVSFWAFVIFGKASKMGLSTEDDAGLAAMFDMVHGCLKPEDGDRFDQIALERRADPDEIFEFIKEIMQRVSSRPTGQPSASSSRERNGSTKLRGSKRQPAGTEALVKVGDALR